MAKKINQITSMPQMGAAFAGWQSSIDLVIITQNIVDGFNTETTSLVTFNGTIQPLQPEKIALKPEDQRSFTWLQIHAFAGLDNLVTNDRIIFAEKRYKIMATLDYSLNNFIEYHAIQDFEDVT